jgi:hypothetical protein
MEYASSLVKSTYKGAKSVSKSATKYASTYFKGDKNKKESKLSWVSYLVFFRSPFGKMILDQATIFVGNVPNHYYAYFTNFVNWKIIDNELYYMGELYNPETDKMVTGVQISPDTVYLHIRHGDIDSNIECITKNPTNYLYFVSDPKNKVYRMIRKQLNPDKVKIYDVTNTFGHSNPDSLKDRSENTYDPRFREYGRQVYGSELEHAMYSGVIPEVI